MTKDIFEDFVVGDFSDENYLKIDLHKNIVDAIILFNSKGPLCVAKVILLTYGLTQEVCPTHNGIMFENTIQIDGQWHFSRFYCRRGRSNTRMVLYS